MCRSDRAEALANAEDDALEDAANFSVALCADTGAPPDEFADSNVNEA